MLKRRLPLFVLPLLVLALVLGLGQLFQLRFDHGDIYPAYSTYRADPLGARVLFEALDELPDTQVARHHEEGYRKLPHGRDHTLIALGVEPRRLLQMYHFGVENLGLFLRQGGRVVIGIKPYPTQSFFEIQEEKARQRTRERWRTRDQNRERKRKEEMSDEPKETDDFDQFEEVEKILRQDLMHEWGIKLAWENLDWDEEFVAQPVTVTRTAHSPRELPGLLPWHSAGVFEIPDELEADWTVHYRRGERPVLVERKIGAGSVVLTTDPFAFSNQALLESRHTSLLSWLLADHRNIMFDESHFGMIRNEGVVTLGRKYRLHGLALGLVVLGLLFVWKNSTSLVPPLDDEIAAGAVRGRDSNAGFLNLLRRTVKPAKLISVCVAEWRKAHPHLKEKGDALLQASRFDRPQDDLVGQYHELREILKPRVK